jgi:hypothetical protein
MMKTINISQSPSHTASISRFKAARALAFSLAESDSDLLEPELVAWMDRSTGMVSPILEGCSGPNGWREYGVSHGGRLEVDIDNDITFIFTDSSPFDSYEHFGPGPFRNLRDETGEETVCLSDGSSCVSLDEWSSKLT